MMISQAIFKKCTGGSATCRGVLTIGEVEGSKRVVQTYGPDDGPPTPVSEHVSNTENARRMSNLTHRGIDHIVPEAVVDVNKMTERQIL
jgi:hypothetical protein